MVGYVWVVVVVVGGGGGGGGGCTRVASNQVNRAAVSAGDSIPQRLLFSFVRVINITYS